MMTLIELELGRLRQLVPGFDPLDAGPNPEEIKEEISSLERQLKELGDELEYYEKPQEGGPLRDKANNRKALDQLEIVVTLHHQYGKEIPDGAMAAYKRAVELGQLIPLEGMNLDDD
jgi:DNA repair exonuclease SbcCD ATPase subunit